MLFFCGWFGCASLTCVEPDEDLWCFHEESAEGPVFTDTDLACPVPVLSASAQACGAFMRDVESGGYTSVSHYFQDGEYVATRYSTDTNRYCGGFAYWYGRKVRCP